MDNLWHYGKVEGNKITFKISKRSEPITIADVRFKPHGITDLGKAIGYILASGHLCRVSGYVGQDGKYHRYTFSEKHGAAGLAMYFFDSSCDVINFAKTIAVNQRMSPLVHEAIGLSWYTLFTRFNEFQISLVLHSFRKKGIMDEEEVRELMCVIRDLKKDDLRRI